MMKSDAMFLLFVTVALINEERMDEGKTVPAAASWPAQHTLGTNVLRTFQK